MLIISFFIHEYEKMTVDLILKNPLLCLYNFPADVVYTNSQSINVTFTSGILSSAVNCVMNLDSSQNVLHTKWIILNSLLE